MLRAWICGDSARLQIELNRTLSFSSPVLDSAEEERLHLLGAVARRMQSMPDRLHCRDYDPGLQLCVDLLMHLTVSPHHEM